MRIWVNFGATSLSLPPAPAIYNVHTVCELYGSKLFPDTDPSIKEQGRGQYGVETRQEAKGFCDARHTRSRFPCTIDLQPSTSCWTVYTYYTDVAEHHCIPKSSVHDHSGDRIAQSSGDDFHDCTPPYPRRLYDHSASSGRR